MGSAPDDLPASLFDGKPEFRIGLRFVESDVEVEIDGELDIATEADLLPVLSTLVEHGWRPRLELAQLRFVDCSGLHALHECSMRLLPDRGRLVLRSPSAMLRRILSLTQLKSWFELEDPTEEMLQARLADPANSFALDVWQINGLPFLSETVDAALRLAISTGVENLGADGASVSLFRDGKLQTVASTDAAWVALDELQYVLAEGPCVEAALTARQTFTRSVGDDERWLRYGESASEGGVEAMLSTPLSARQTDLGALNLYWRRPRSPAEGSDVRAKRLADSVSELLGQAGAALPHEEVVRRVEAALHTRNEVALAVGILMEREQVDKDRAFLHLGHLAAARDVSMTEIAAEVTRSTPNEVGSGERS